MGVKPTVQVFVVREGFNEYERIMPKDIEIVDDDHVRVKFSIPMFGKKNAWQRGGTVAFYQRSR
jgi:hypothetical protein